MHDCTHQYHMRKQRINTVPTCTKSIPHSSLLDDHSSCIIRKYGEAIEVVHQKDDKNTSTINLSSTAPTQLLSALEAELSNLNSIHISYQPLIQAATQLLKKEPSFHGIPVSSKCMRRRLLSFLGGCTQLVNRDIHNQGHQCHQNKDQPIDCHSTEPTGDPSSCHIYT